MDRAKNKKGFVLPLVLFLSVIMFIGVVFLSLHSRVTATNTINLNKQLASDSNTDAALQQGLAILTRRISYLPDRITNGIPDVSAPGGKRLISNDNVSNYVNTSPCSFWVEWMNDINGETNFALENPSTASFEVDTSSYHLKISLLSAVNPANAQAENTSGYNNVTLRYGYQITAIEKLSGRGKSQSIISSMRAEHQGELIQVHLVRELSRYNLFAINNKTKSGTILYDRTSYTGRVYSKNTFYVSGTGTNEPRYGDVVEISNVASPSYLHKDGIAFTFKHPDDTPNPPVIVPPVDLPSSIEMDSQKDLCHRMSSGQNPDALTTPGVYVGTSSINGVVKNTSIYVNGGADNTSVLISIPSLGVNRFTINSVAGGSRVIDQDVTASPGFVVFVDGKMSIEGKIAEGTKLTVNGRDNILITSDLNYESGVMSANTVLGLVSWTGDVLVARNIPPLPGHAVKELSLHGVIMTIDGAFGVEGGDDFNANYSGYAGTIYHKGAFVRKWGLPTMSPDGSKGWGLVSEYDPYLKEAKAPPFFPGNGAYKLVDQNQSKVIDVYFRKSL